LTTGQATSYLTLSIYLVLLGVGTGLFVAPNLCAVMSSVPVERHGVGSVLFTLFLNIGLNVSHNVSLTVPYDLITQILAAVNPTSISPADIALFVSSLKNTYLAFAIINAVALIPAVIGAESKKQTTQMSR